MEPGLSRYDEWVERIGVGDRVTNPPTARREVTPRPSNCCRPQADPVYFARIGDPEPTFNVLPVVWVECPF